MSASQRAAEAAPDMAAAESVASVAAAAVSDPGASFAPASPMEGVVAATVVATPEAVTTSVSAAGAASAPGAEVPAPASSPVPASADAAITELQGPLVASAPSGRCAGLEYANLKKEEAREQYKDRRRKELLQLGEVDRVKRRKKGDGSKSPGEKYSRRLKMNQDSAAAARAAQDAYIKALEQLVETGEEEKNLMDLEAVNLRVEREQLVQRLSMLHHEAQKSLLEADANHVSHLPDTVVPEGTDSLRLLQKMMEVYEGDGGTTALTDEADFARGMMGLMPAPAV